MKKDSNPDATGPRLVPPPPPRGATPARKRGKKSDPRAWMWPGGFALGVTLGIVAYQFGPGLDFYFDYWVALLF